MNERSAKVLALLVLTMTSCVFADDRPAVISFPATKPSFVPAEVMQQIYDAVESPHKYGIVLQGEEGELLDGPAVFRHNGRWYMVFVSNKNNVGYEAELAVSDDLLRWQRLGTLLPFSGQGWDAWQANANLALFDTSWDDASHTLDTYDGQYWISYFGGSKKGYETDPLSIGVATSVDPVALQSWQRYANNPVLSPDQSDARDFEHRTLYTSFILKDDEETLGAPFVMFYNGKAAPHGHEAIGIAVSDDMLEWRRFGHGPVVANIGPSPWAISGNPQIVKIGDVWVMFYFGAFWKPGAFDTFAASYDLVNWSKWDGPHLVEPSEPWDETFAHKPWVIKHDGVVYHFYCAVGDQGRVIALATSKKL